MRFIITFTLLIILASGLNACTNTAHGFGKDLTEAGHAIQSATN